MTDAALKYIMSKYGFSGSVPEFINKYGVSFLNKTNQLEINVDFNYQEDKSVGHVLHCFDYDKTSETLAFEPADDTYTQRYWLHTYVSLADINNMQFFALGKTEYRKEYEKRVVQERVDSNFTSRPHQRIKEASLVAAEVKHHPDKVQQ